MAPQALATPLCLLSGGGEVSGGDSAPNFELRAWTGDFGGWYQIRSELAVAVYDAGYAAGMSFPFPQREVRLLRDVPAEPEPAGSGKSDRSAQEGM